MISITLKVNGKAHTVDVDPGTPLLYVLRNDLGPRKSDTITQSGLKKKGC